MKHEPVSDYENAKVDGAALMSERVYKKSMEFAEDLRARQAAYLDSLPKTDTDAVAEGLSILHPDGENYPEGFEEAYHCAVAIEAICQSEDNLELRDVQETLAWLSRKVAVGLYGVRRDLAHLSKVLGRPQEIEREAAEG